MAQVVSKVFFGQSTAFKITLNKDGDVYFNLGKKSNESWSWKKAKMNDVELGEILSVLEGSNTSTSFYHEFGGEKKQIWINAKGDALFIKIDDYSKGLNPGEQMVLRELLKHCMLRMNMEL